MATATNNRGAVATVRIAPIEHWCAGSTAEAKERMAKDFCVGMAVQIYPQRIVSWEFCDGRVWIVSQQTHNSIRERNGKPLPTAEETPAGLCEHMLEMD